MAKGLGHFTRTDQRLGLRVDPKVVLSSSILQMTQPELDQAIRAELNDNPALERLNDEHEELTDEMILRSVAPQELRPQSEDHEFKRSLSNDDDGADWLDYTVSLPSLHDHLRGQLSTALPHWLEDLSEYVVGCVNDKGYLTMPAEEIALTTEHTLEDVELVIQKLRDCEPAGVGAYDLNDCLLLQLRPCDTYEEKLARTILKNHMDEFLSGAATKLARRYKVMPDVVEAAFDLIRSLDPYPGETFSPVNARLHAQSVRAPSVTPDVTIRRSEFGWEVDVRGADANAFSINRAYRKRYEELKNDSRAPKDETQHISQYVKRAANFIQCVHARKKTLRRIGEYLLQNQPGFVATGEYQFLRALTRTQLAKDLGMHESTVSRATLGKFVQLGNGEIVPFEVFFKPALRIQRMIEEILETENPSRPLSDEAIAKMLAKQGVQVARRTVNKYRDKTKLLSSRKRRSA